MKSKEEDWIDEVMNSHNGKLQLLPSKSLYGEIFQQIKKSDRLPIRYIGLSSAAAVVLILLNSWAVSLYTTQTTQHETVVSSVDGDFLSEYNYYDYE